MSYDRLEKWLNRMVTDLTDEGPVTRFELWHAVDGVQTTRLETIALPSLGAGSIGLPKKSDEDEDEDEESNEDEDEDEERSLSKPIDDIPADEISAADILESFVQAAESDCSTRLGSPQRYVAFAFRAEKAQDHSAAQAFLVHAPRDRRTNFGDDSEPGTERGVTAHVLRHNENVHRILIQGSETMLGQSLRELERERKMRISAEEFRERMFEKYQELLDRTTERRLHEARELQKAKRLDELMGMVTAMIPLALAKLLPQAAPQLTNGAEDPTLMGVQKIFGNMTQEELMGVLGALNEPNRIAVMQLYERLREKDAAERAQKPEILQ